MVCLPFLRIMGSYVGYKEDQDVQLTPGDHAVAGAVSGMVTRALIQPLDVLKIRFQLQIEPTTRRGGGLYHGIFQSLFTIAKSEGPSALWKGHLPAQALSVGYGVAQFWSYAVLTQAATEHGFPHGLCGGLAGFCGTLVSMPCDVIRTRMVAQGTPKYYSGMMDAAVKMVRQEGALSLWRGFLPTVAMNAPSSGLIFYFYHAFLALTNNLIGDVFHLPWLSCSALSGMAAGVCAKAILYPLDVLKKRMQIRGFESNRKQFGKVIVYTNVWKYISTVMQEEGMQAWFKGLCPSMIKSGLATGVIFVSYEATCYVISVARGKSTSPDDTSK